MTKTNKRSGNPAVKAQNKPKETTRDKGTICLGWCDGGNTDGKFTEGVVYSIIERKVPIASAMRVQGNQIGRQRQTLFDTWLDNSDSEWLLWVDSDIALTSDALQKVWQAADSVERPVVSGVYFISKENESSLMTPYPAVFNFTDNPNVIAYLHPLPANTIIKAGCAGFGFLLMHKSVGLTMRKNLAPRTGFFNETGVGEGFISEDIHFFTAMQEAGIPLHVHTGAVVKHMKRFAFDLEFYKLFWNNYEQTNKRSEA